MDPGRRIASGSERPARFRRGADVRLAIGLLASVAIHAAVFTLAPSVPLSDDPLTPDRIQVVMLPDRDWEPPPVVEIPRPPDLVTWPAPPLSANGPTAPVALDRPPFIPFEVPPRLMNRGEVQDLLAERYPEPLRERGATAEVVMWMFVGSDGRVTEARVDDPSSLPRFDRVARDVARAMRFEPALNHGRPTAVWVRQSIVFRPDSTRRVGPKVGSDAGFPSAPAHEPLH